MRINPESQSREETMENLIALILDHGEADFFLKYSVENHVE
jgi:hypothetical protein